MQGPVRAAAAGRSPQTRSHQRVGGHVAAEPERERGQLPSAACGRPASTAARRILGERHLARTAARSPTRRSNVVAEAERLKWRRSRGPRAGGDRGRQPTSDEEPAMSRQDDPMSTDPTTRPEQLTLPGQSAHRRGTPRPDRHVRHAPRLPPRPRRLRGRRRATPRSPTHRPVGRAPAHGGLALADVLHHHHGVEDVALWPVLRRHADDARRRGRTSRTLADMEAEHGVIDPALEAVRDGLRRDGRAPVRRPPQRAGDPGRRRPGGPARAPRPRGGPGAADAPAHPERRGERRRSRRRPRRATRCASSRSCCRG